MLLELYGFLIDADKNGICYDNDALDRFLAKLVKKGWIYDTKFPKAAHEKAMELGLNAKTVTIPANPTHPNDIIFFKYVRPQTEKILKQLSDFVEKSKSFTDHILLSIHKEFSSSPEAEIKAEMKRLESALKDLQRRWQNAFNNSCISNQSYRGNQIGVIINQLKSEYRRTKPINTDLTRMWTTPRIPQFSQEPSIWALLKASTLYALFHGLKRDSIIWQFAAPELAYIKVHSTKHRLIVEQQYALLKTRKRKVKILLGRTGRVVEGGDGENEDIFGSVSEVMEVDD
jgi:hypothetical protein